MIPFFRNISCLFLLLMWGQLLQAQTVTYTEDIAPIIYQNCTQCHRSGEIGPMPFTNYFEVVSWGSMIEYVTSIGYMPPWPADPTYSEFLGERFLTDQEIQLISDWVQAGMPEGPKGAEPPLPVFPSGSQVGQPDTTLSFTQAFVHQGNNTDQYQVFVLPTELTEDKILKAIELRPGNPKIVHHALFRIDTSGQAQALDAQTPEYGYEGFGGFGTPDLVDYPAYVPGAKPRYYPEGLGQPMYKGSDLLVQMHYAPVASDEEDSSTVNLFFADPAEVIDREIERQIMLPFGRTIQNGPFIMPANTVKRFHCKWDIPAKVSVLGLAPHCHLLGQDWEVFALNPQGDTIKMVNIPEWDFNWQGTYFFKRFIVLEQGSEIHAYASYDNTTNNPFNPNNPPQFVTWGEGTADEMFYLPFTYVPYKTGDELIVFDDFSTSKDREIRFPEDKLYPPYPNPARDKVTIGFRLSQLDEITLSLYDMKGQQMMKPVQDQPFGVGPHKVEVPTYELSPGLYFVQLQSGRLRMTQKLVIR